MTREQPAQITWLPQVEACKREQTVRGENEAAVCSLTAVLRDASTLRKVRHSLQVALFIEQV